MLEWVHGPESNRRCSGVNSKTVQTQEPRGGIRAKSLHWIVDHGSALWHAWAD